MTGTKSKRLQAVTENRFRLALATAPLAVFNQDRELRYTWIVNPSRGEQVADVLGRTDEEIVGAGEAARLTAIKRSVLITGEPRHEEVAFRHRDVETQFDLFVEPLRDESGAIVGITGAAYDITENRATAAALALSEERHRLISSLISDYAYGGTVATDGTTTTEWVSGAFERITGFTLDEVNALPGGFAALVLAQDLNPLISVLPSEAGEATRTYEYRIRRKDDTIRWIRDSMQLIVDAAGSQRVKVIGAVRDITAQKLAEAELAVKQHDLEALIDNADGTIWAIDTHCRLLTGNAQYYANMRAILGRDIAKHESVIQPVFPAAVQEEWQQYYARALQGERFTTEVTSCFVEADRVHEYRFSPIATHDGTVTGATVFGRDITAQKHAADALRESEARFRTLFESSDAIMGIVDPESGRIVDVNPAAAAFYGYPRATFLTMNIDDISIVSSAEEAADREAAMHRRQNSVVVPNRLADGEIRMVEIRSSLIELGARQLIFAIIFDVTERHLSEQLVYAQRDLARGMSRVTSSAEGWQLCLEVALRLPGLDSGGIYLFDRDERVLELVYHTGLGAEFVREVARYPRDGANVQMVLAGATGYFVGEEVSRHEIYRSEGLQAIIIVPIRHQDRAIGCLNLGSHSSIQIPALTRQALETIAAEIGNFTIYLRAIADLRESEEKYRSLVEASDAVIMMADYDGRVHYVNAKAAESIGRSIDATVGHTLHELLPPSRAAINLRSAQAVIDTNQPLVVEAPVGARWYRTSVQPVRDAGGKPHMVLISATDITELKQTQQELVDLNRTLEARVEERTAEVQDLYEHAPNGYHSLDGEGRILRINQTELDWMGYAREEVIGRSVAEFLTPASVTILRAELPAFKQRGSLRDVEVEYVRKDGSILPVIVSATALYDETGNFVMSRSTIFDNTDRRRAAEAQRAATAEMARAMQLKDEFLANMSHELRTPLNAILTVTEVMAEQIYGPLNERQQRSLQQLDASGRHLLALISDVLDLSKIEAGKLDLELAPVLPDEICQESLLLVKGMAAKKRIQVTYRNVDLNTTVMADPRRLKQMLVNLLSNAVKFTPNGGQVQLEVEKNPDSGNIQFAVQDTGPGIAADDIPRLFQPFTQLDAALSRQFEGTGLGLALVKRLALQHGGTVGVESAGIPGQGSRFTLTLPAVTAESTLPPAASHAGQPLRVGQAKTELAGARILLAEDNDVSVDSVSGYLDFLGYHVVVARTGPDALAFAQADPPDLILMDIQLPLMDGMEVTRRLRRDPRLITTPIIALTALAMPGDRERCMAAGATAYVSKPVRLTELTASIARLLHASTQDRR